MIIGGGSDRSVELYNWETKQQCFIEPLPKVKCTSYTILRKYTLLFCLFLSRVKSRHSFPGSLKAFWDNNKWGSSGVWRRRRF
jgi:hypothetical protein